MAFVWAHIFYQLISYFVLPWIATYAELLYLHGLSMTDIVSNKISLLASSGCIIIKNREHNCLKVYTCYSTTRYVYTCIAFSW